MRSLLFFVAVTTLFPGGLISQIPPDYQIVSKRGLVEGDIEAPHRIIVVINPKNKNEDDMARICRKLVTDRVTDNGTFYFFDDIEAAKIHRILESKFYFSEYTWTTTNLYLKPSFSKAYYPHIVGSFYYLSIGASYQKIHFFPRGLDIKGHQVGTKIVIDISRGSGYP